MDVSVVWFRRDLRLHDNEAVASAAATKNCIFVFVIDPWFYSQPEIGWLRVKFMFESLAELDSTLQRTGNQLLILRGETVQVLSSLLQLLVTNNHRPQLYFNRDIQVDYGRKRDEAVITFCQKNAVLVHLSHNNFLLQAEIQMNDWWRQYHDYQYDKQLAVPAITAVPEALERLISVLPQINPQTIADELAVTLPTAKQVFFSGGEIAARQSVYSFLKDRVDGYRWKISRPYLVQHGATSLLGPHLAFGTISNRTVFQSAVKYQAKLESRYPKKAFDITTYLDRLRWRDSFTQRLWFHPELAWKNRFSEFDKLYNMDPLSDQQQEYFESWQQGKTGFPLLDAAMLQLSADGFINFRMRAMAATFLTINCGISWHHGARHFMNCLVDGDIAINHWQWQMQAGITNPLSPTFRMYSPTKNFHDRDGSADYVHFWLPETQGKAIDAILADAKPMLDFNLTRKVNGKKVADIRKIIRERLLLEKGNELVGATVAHKTVQNYKKFTGERYKRYIK